MKKKLQILTLVVIMAFGLQGCSNLGPALVGGAIGAGVVLLAVK